MLLLLSICLSVTARVICILCIIIIMWMNPLLFLFLHSAFIPSFFLLLFDDFFNISCLNGLSPWFTSWLRHIKSTWQWRHTHTLKRSLIKMTLRNVAWYYCKHKQHFMPVVDHWLCIIQTLKLNVFIERLELCITKKVSCFDTNKLSIGRMLFSLFFDADVWKSIRHEFHNTTIITYKCTVDKCMVIDTFIHPLSIPFQDAIWVF